MRDVDSADWLFGLGSRLIKDALVEEDEAYFDSPFAEEWAGLYKVDLEKVRRKWLEQGSQ